MIVPHESGFIPQNFHRRRRDIRRMVQYHAERRSGVASTDVRYFTDDIGLFFCYTFHEKPP
jgi:hypothetical protein